MDRTLEAVAPSEPAVVDVAGRSANATYERRLDRHQQRVAARRTKIIVVGVCIVIGGLALALGGRAMGPTWPFLGAAIAFAGSMWVLGQLFGVPDSALNWRRGAAGEEETGRILARLSPDFSVLHDRRIPLSQANVDHIVIGPTGVFVIETKRYSGRLTVHGAEVFVAGRRRTKIVEQALWEAEVVRRVLAEAGERQQVTPLLCVHHAQMPWRAARVAGVSIVSAARLVEMLTRGPTILESTQAVLVREKIARAMPRA